MRLNLPNPFNITKASDFSDTQIGAYWVDIPNGGFAELAKPTSPMPMLILGGKGSGKTHLMRYFSYPLQKIRHANDVRSGVVTDGYLGVYLRCGGLNSARFANKGQSEEAWLDVFAYSFELGLSQLLLSTVFDTFFTTDEYSEREALICRDMDRVIEWGTPQRPLRLAALSDLLAQWQKEIDVAVNNSAITRNLDVNIRIARGRLIFGLPKSFAQRVPEMSELIFLYLIDEFEHLSEPQQKYINTLMREKELPASIKVGARLYGVRTYQTYCADEENKEGSEYEELHLDAILRANRHYSEFAKKLCLRRLRESGPNRLLGSEDSTAIASLEESFATIPRDRYATEETRFVLQKYSPDSRPYFRALREKLQKGIEAGVTTQFLDRADIPEILSALAVPDYPLLEKANIFQLYRAWSSGEHLNTAARKIQAACAGFLRKSPSQAARRYRQLLGHYKSDLLAQLLRECDHKQRYLGLDTFVEMSNGLPRNLLIILKHIFQWAVFSGERPFHHHPISIEAQQKGVREASNWFFHNARGLGSDGVKVQDALGRLAELFRGIRFSDKPAECSVIAFSVDPSKVSSDTRRIIEIAERWSLLIGIPGGQRDRNTKRIDHKYKLNSMLSPRWDLPIAYRGAIALNPSEADAIFSPRSVNEFETVRETRIGRMTAPHFGRSRSEPSEDQIVLPGLRND